MQTKRRKAEPQQQFSESSGFQCVRAHNKVQCKPDIQQISGCPVGLGLVPVKLLPWNGLAVAPAILQGHVRR